VVFKLNQMVVLSTGRRG